MRLQELKIFVEENIDHPVFTSKIGWRAKYDELLYGDFVSVAPPTQAKLVEVINLLLRQAMGVIDGLESRTNAGFDLEGLGEAIYKEHDEWWGAVYECSRCDGEWMLNSNKEKAMCCPHCGAVLWKRKEQSNGLH